MNITLEYTDIVAGSWSPILLGVQYQDLDANLKVVMKGDMIGGNTTVVESYNLDLSTVNIEFHMYANNAGNVYPQTLLWTNAPSNFGDVRVHWYEDALDVSTSVLVTAVSGSQGSTYKQLRSNYDMPVGFRNQSTGQIVILNDFGVDISDVSGTHVIGNGLLLDGTVIT